MIATLMGAACALALEASVMATPADTMNIYLINGEKVEKFDGSQLVGKTVSDYKTTVMQSTVNGKTTITKVHTIRTDGKQAKTVSTSMTTVSNGTAGNATITIVGSDADSRASVSMSGVKEDNVEVFINGKKKSKAAMAKLKPGDILSMTVLKAGSKAAVEKTKSKDRDVIVITLK